MRRGHALDRRVGGSCPGTSGRGRAVAASRGDRRRCGASLGRRPRKTPAGHTGARSDACPGRTGGDEMSCRFRRRCAADRPLPWCAALRTGWRTAAAAKRARRSHARPRCSWAGPSIANARRWRRSKRRTRQARSRQRRGGRPVASNHRWRCKGANVLGPCGRPARCRFADLVATTAPAFRLRPKPLLKTISTRDVKRVKILKLSAAMGVTRP
jgi:hypothetical protein